MPVFVVNARMFVHVSLYSGPEPFGIQEAHLRVSVRAAESHTAGRDRHTVARESLKRVTDGAAFSAATTMDPAESHVGELGGATREPTELAGCLGERRGDKREHGRHFRSA